MEDTNTIFEQSVSKILDFTQSPQASTSFVKFAGPAIGQAVLEENNENDITESDE